MQNKFNLAVYIGRFQPFHIGHLHAIREGLKIADKVLVLVGTTGGPATIKNPFNFSERDHMIYYSLEESERARVVIMSLQDHPYSNTSWFAGVMEEVDHEAKPGDKIALIGHLKDDSSFYLKNFPQYTFVDTGYADINGDEGNFDATAIRRMIFENKLQYAIGIVPEPALRIMKNLIRENSEFWDELKKEYHFIQEYRKSWETAPFPPVFVTTDAIVVQSGHILMVTRGQSPGKGLLAIPGGFIDQKESIEDCAIRELIEETNIHLQEDTLRRCITDVKVFDRAGGVSFEDRGRIITHVHVIRLDDSKPLPKVRAGDDAWKAQWVPLNELYRSHVFSDHYDIIHSCLGLS